MTSPFPQIATPPQTNAQVLVNEALDALKAGAVYAKAYQTSSGLTWGYYGGRWGGFSIAAGTLTLTANDTNDIVVEIATGDISVGVGSDSLWDDSDYLRVYRLTTDGTGVTAEEDHRAGPGGVYSGGGGVTIDTDGTLAGNSDAVVASQKATKTYVDAKVAGLSWKQAVRAASTGPVTLSSAVENGDTLDGVTLATGDRILLKDQGTASQNGIYIVAASGAPSRATDADSGAELVNASVYVSEGTTNADTQWTCTTNAPITPGSTSLAFAQLSTGSSAASGISVTDSGGYYTGSDVEAILQEIGAALASAGGGSVGTPKTISATFSRPANTTAYSAGKVLADATSGATMLAFSSVGASNGGGFTLKQVILKDSAINSSGSAYPDFMLHLFSAALGTPLNDGANFDLSDSEVLTLIGSVPIYGQSDAFVTNITAGEGSGASGNRVVYVNGLDTLIVCGGSTTSVYAVIECLNAWTPVSGESFQIDLVGFQH